MKEKSLDSFECQDCIDLSHVILVTVCVIGSHLLEKMGIPERTATDLHLFENRIYVSRQLSLKPVSVRQILVQPGNSQGRT